MGRSVSLATAQAEGIDEFYAVSPGSREPQLTRRSALAAAAAAWWAAGVAALAGVLVAPADDRRGALVAALFSVAMLLCAAAVSTAPRQRVSLSELPDAGTALLVAGALALTVDLAIRLLCAPRFGGSAANFDFGRRCTGRCGGAEQRDKAFEPGPGSLGRCLQGFAAILLSSAAERVCPVCVRALSGLSAAWPVRAVYWALLERRRSAGAFAASSFCKDAAEWAVGFWLGIAAGCVADALAARKQFRRNSGAAIDDTAPKGLMSAYWHDRAARAAAPCVYWLRVALGGALCTAAIAAGALIGASWGASGANGRLDGGVLAVMLAVPITIFTGAFVLALLAPLDEARSESFRQEPDDPRIF
ncbi:hypothetical protein M885DRAFT_520852 [Pelagophyceae sp. CCMP2097]|nr:hypothetical protein M885DRAFT_520852 [Pelagophyceae sp. CCMP2097]